MIYRKKVKIHIIQMLFTLFFILLFSFTACNSSSIPSYEKYINPNWKFTIDYPKGWQQQVDEKYPDVEGYFSGFVDSSSVKITVIYLEISYDEMVDLFNTPKNVAKIEYRDKFINNINYSTFTQIVDNIFTRIYICELADNEMVMLSADIDNNASQKDKDTLESYSLHMVGSLQQNNN